MEVAAVTVSINHLRYRGDIKQRTRPHQCTNFHGINPGNECFWRCVVLVRFECPFWARLSREHPADGANPCCLPQILWHWTPPTEAYWRGTVLRWLSQQYPAWDSISQQKSNQNLWTNKIDQWINISTFASQNVCIGPIFSAWKHRTRNRLIVDGLISVRDDNLQLAENHTS